MSVSCMDSTDNPMNLEHVIEFTAQTCSCNLIIIEREEIKTYSEKQTQRASPPA